MKTLFILLIAAITCFAIEDIRLGRVPAHPMKRFFDSLRADGTYQKIQEEYNKKGRLLAIKLCKELIPEVPELVTHYFSTNEEFCPKFVGIFN